MARNASQGKYSTLAEELLDLPSPSGQSREQRLAATAALVEKIMGAQHRRALYAKIILDTLVYYALGTGFAAFAVNVWQKGDRTARPCAIPLAVVFVLLIAVGVVAVASYIGIDAIDDLKKVGRETMTTAGLITYTVICTALPGAGMVAIFATLMAPR